MQKRKLPLGILTIKEVRGDCYVLGYPNREVKKAMFDMVFRFLSSIMQMLSLRARRKRYV